MIRKRNYNFMKNAIFYRISDAEDFFLETSVGLIKSFDKTSISPLNITFDKVLKRKDEAFANAEEETLCFTSKSFKPEGNYEFKGTKGLILNLTFDLEFSGKNCLEASAIFYASVQEGFNKIFRSLSNANFYEINLLNSSIEIAYTKFQLCVIKNTCFKFPLILTEVQSLQKTNILIKYV